MNYGQLKSALSGWTQRTDMGAIAPTLIQLAEARIAREFRLQNQVTVTTLTANAASIALPADFLEFKALVYADYSPAVKIGTLEKVLDERARISGDRPTTAVVAGGQLQLGPVPGSSYTINAAYYARFPALSADTDTNWLLTNYPSVYLFAALAEAQPYMMDDARIALWEGKYAQERESLKLADKMAEFGGNGLELSNMNTHEVV